MLLITEVSQLINANGPDATAKIDSVVTSNCESAPQTLLAAVTKMATLPMHTIANQKFDVNQNPLGWDFCVMSLEL